MPVLDAGDSKPAVCEGGPGGWSAAGAELSVRERGRRGGGGSASGERTRNVPAKGSTLGLLFFPPSCFLSPPPTGVPLPVARASTAPASTTITSESSSLALPLPFAFFARLRDLGAGGTTDPPSDSESDPDDDDAAAEGARSWASWCLRMLNRVCMPISLASAPPLEARAFLMNLAAAGRSTTMVPVFEYRKGV